MPNRSESGGESSKSFERKIKRGPQKKNRKKRTQNKDFYKISGGGGGGGVVGLYGSPHLAQKR